MSASAADVHGIGQIHVSVTDLDSSVSFYRDVLGLRHLFTVPGQPMAFFDAGGVRLHLGVPEDERFGSRPVLHSRWTTSRPRSTSSPRAGRRSCPARTSCTPTTGASSGWRFVSDPDGTPLALVEERPRQGVT